MVSLPFAYFDFADAECNTHVGALLIYLPPYSPDFNPIEEAFSAIKAWLRRHEAQFDAPEKLPWMIHSAIASVTSRDAFGWFDDCGYVP